MLTIILVAITLSVFASICLGMILYGINKINSLEDE